MRVRTVCDLLLSIFFRACVVGSGDRFVPEIWHPRDRSLPSGRARGASDVVTLVAITRASPPFLLRGRAPWQNGRNSLSRAGKGPSSRVKNKKSKTTVSAFPNLSTNEKTLYDDSIIHESQNKA